MQATCAFADPMFRHCARIVGKYGGVRHRTLLQADAVSVFEVNCRDDQHDMESIRRAERTSEMQSAGNGYSNYDSCQTLAAGMAPVRTDMRLVPFQETKFDNRRKPADWLFSG